jgi:hypothetical protein
MKNAAVVATSRVKLIITLARYCMGVCEPRPPRAQRRSGSQADALVNPEA